MRQHPGDGGPETAAGAMVDQHGRAVNKGKRRKRAKKMKAGDKNTPEKDRESMGEQKMRDEERKKAEFMRELQEERLKALAAVMQMMKHKK